MADVRVAGESSKQEAVWPLYGNDLENVGAKDKLPGRTADKMYQEDRKHQGLCYLKEPEAGSPAAPGMLRRGPSPDPKRDDMPPPPGQPGSPLVTRGREKGRVKATCSGASWSPEAGTLSAGTGWLGPCALPPRPAPQGPQLSRVAFSHQPGQTHSSVEAVLLLKQNLLGDVVCELKQSRLATGLWRAVGEGRPETKHPQTRTPCPGQGPAQPAVPYTGLQELQLSGRKRAWEHGKDAENSREGQRFTLGDMLVVSPLGVTKACLVRKAPLSMTPPGRLGLSSESRQHPSEQALRGP